MVLEIKLPREITDQFCNFDRAVTKAGVPAGVNQRPPELTAVGKRSAIDERAAATYRSPAIFRIGQVEVRGHHLEASNESDKLCVANGSLAGSDRTSDAGKDLSMSGGFTDTPQRHVTITRGPVLD